VCAIDTEFKVPRILGGRQFVQLMAQLLGIVVRQTSSRVLNLNRVSESGVRWCLEL
jgi:hypothetical protein